MDVATVIEEGEHSPNHRAGTEMEKKKKLSGGVRKAG